ncbi:MAG: hypothetical protein FIA92_13905 [Chloroflexi bacterium]|nr:hypothetical protein [Chloroflexota bacterium]
MTLVGQTVTVTTPGVLYDVVFTPSTEVQFSQQPGEVVNVSMIARSAGDDTLVFCDIHAAVHASGIDQDEMPIVMHETVLLAQRGDDWWRMAEWSGDLSRTIPAPAAATVHTILGKVWMDAPAEEGGDCYGLEVGGQHVDFTVDLRVSIVTMSGT